MRISDWSSDVCSSDLPFALFRDGRRRIVRGLHAPSQESSIFQPNDEIWHPLDRTASMELSSVSYWRKARAVLAGGAIILRQDPGQPDFLRSPSYFRADRKSTRLNSSH